MEHVTRPTLDRDTRGGSVPGGPPTAHRRGVAEPARRMLALVLALLVSIAGFATPAAAVVPSAPGVRAPAANTAIAPLTNLAHLDFLLDEATPPADVEGHTTYRLDEEPTLILPWTYADARPGGTFERVGGGPRDAATGYWGQGVTTPTTSRAPRWCTSVTGR